MSKFESFNRQVNGWGFKRITQGPDATSYYHELFLQGMPHLVKWMKRIPPSKGQIKRLRPSPKDEPNFYEISANYPIPDHYLENRGRPVSMSLPFGRIGMPPVAQNKPTRPSRVGGMRRKGGIFNNDGHNHISSLQCCAANKDPRAVSSYASEDQSDDNYKLFEINSSSERQMISFPSSPSKRMKIDQVDRSSAVNGGAVRLDNNSHDCNSSMLQEGFPRNMRYGQHNNDLRIRRSLYHKDLEVMNISNEEISNNGQHLLGLTREEELAPPSENHWKMFCEVIADPEDAHIAMEVSTNSSQMDDQGRCQDGDDDDDDSFCRMITESVNFDPDCCHENLNPSQIQFQSW